MNQFRATNPIGIGGLTKVFLKKFGKVSRQILSLTLGELYSLLDDKPISQEAQKYFLDLKHKDEERSQNDSGCCMYEDLERRMQQDEETKNSSSRIETPVGTEELKEIFTREFNRLNRQEILSLTLGKLYKLLGDRIVLEETQAYFLKLKHVDERNDRRMNNDSVHEEIIRTKIGE